MTDDTARENAFVSGSGKGGGGGLSFDEAKAAREKFLALVSSTDDRSEAINAAAGLLLDQKFGECIEAYKVIAETYPDERATAESQIGACKFFLGDPEGAIGHYVAAKNLGADAEMMDDNVWEAVEALYRKSQDEKWPELYLQHFPDGVYAERAKNPSSIGRGGCAALAMLIPAAWFAGSQAVAFLS